MMLLNLTPHPIVVRHEDHSETTIPTSGTVARVNSPPGLFLGVVDGVPLYGPPIWGDVQDLPAPEPGVTFIVSLPVAMRCPDRPDVVSPGTGPADKAVRNDVGQVIAVTRFIAACDPHVGEVRI